MPQAKKPSKRKHRACAVPLLGAAGLSLSLASGASAATVGPAAHEITLGEEEISDVSLGDVLCLRQREPKHTRLTTRQTRRLPRLPWLPQRLPSRLRRLPSRLRGLPSRLRRLPSEAATAATAAEVAAAEAAGGCGGAIEAADFFA